MYLASPSLLRLIMLVYAIRLEQGVRNGVFNCVRDERKVHILTKGKCVLQALVIKLVLKKVYTCGGLQVCKYSVSSVHGVLELLLPSSYTLLCVQTVFIKTFIFPICTYM